MQSEIIASEPPSQFEGALADLAGGFSRSWMWSAMAMQDIRLRYRGSVLGPFWLTLSTSILLAAMGLLYARLFGTEASRYVPFLTIGLVLWQFVSSTLTEGCQSFLSAQQTIQQACLPFSVHAWRTVYRNFIVLLHCVVIFPIVLVLFPTPVDWRVITIAPAVAVLAINAFWITMLLGMMSARYRDIPPIVASAVQVVFFVTPIFWPPDLLGEWQHLLALNPFFAAIDVVRAPLLGAAPLPYSWATLMVVTVLGSLCTFGIFARFRQQIAYWV
jgi:ABC-type polysaccharide/polyol phosphate export permease